MNRYIYIISVHIQYSIYKGIGPSSAEISYMRVAEDTLRVFIVLLLSVLVLDFSRDEKYFISIKRGGNFLPMCMLPDLAKEKAKPSEQ